MYEDLLETANEGLLHFPGDIALLSAKVESLVYLFNFAEGSEIERRYKLQSCITSYVMQQRAGDYGLVERYTKKPVGVLPNDVVNYIHGIELRQDPNS